VPGESTGNPAAWERIERLLAELREGCGEAEQFFSGMFDQLDRLCTKRGQAGRSPTPPDDKLQKQILAEQSHGAREIERMGRLLEEIAERLGAGGLPASRPPR
jgi:hypothetical protein